MYFAKYQNSKTVSISLQIQNPKFNLAPTFFQTSNSETVHKKIKSSSAQRLNFFFSLRWNFQYTLNGFDQIKKIASIFEGPCQTSQCHDPMTAGEIELGDLLFHDEFEDYFFLSVDLYSFCVWSHRWADLSCYHILHGWDSIGHNLNFVFLSGKFFSLKVQSKLGLTVAMIRRPTKISVLLKGSSFLLFRSKTDKIDFY